jgi:surface protein
MDQSEESNSSLAFVKPINKIVNYREEQSELIEKAMIISGGNPFNALKYIVACLTHEGHDIEFQMVVVIPSIDDVGGALQEKYYSVVFDDEAEEEEEEREKAEEEGSDKGTEEEEEEEYYSVVFDEEAAREKKAEKETIYKYKTKPGLWICLPIIKSDPKDELGYYVSWGDGITTHNKDKHKYKLKKEEMTYTIRFFGLGISGYGVKDDTEILSDDDLEGDFFTSYLPYTLVKVISFGNLGHIFTSLEYAFYKCRALTSVPQQIPLSVTNLGYMFSNCVEFNDSVDSWDTSSVTHMNNMFEQCIRFNQPLNNWNTSSVVNMCNMFCDCLKFNQPLNKWDTSSVVNMQGLFTVCTEFNQPLDNWNVSKVTNFKSMFSSCLDFNQPLDSWGLQLAATDAMFNGCVNFNQPLISWKVNKNKIAFMFENCEISEANKPQIYEE